MTESCNNSSSCSENCNDNKQETTNFMEQPHELSKIKKVIGIVSGKGGVGKSLVTSLLAVSMNRLGYKVAVLDADITGPSIPKAFGIKEKAIGSKLGLLPLKSETGIEIMSLNLLLEKDTDPVLWRGPVVASTVKQFWTDVIWDNIDYMFIDMPPGTGDVPLTVFQSIPVDGIIVVTSPQELVSMIVGKAVNMANIMDIPILGIVENLSYFECPDCGKRHEIFGDSHIKKTAYEYCIDVIAQMPIDKSLAEQCDKGKIELFKGSYLNPLIKKIESMEEII